MVLICFLSSLVWAIGGTGCAFGGTVFKVVWFWGLLGLLELSKKIVGLSYFFRHYWSKNMSGLDVLQSVQFVTVKGKRLAILDADNWEMLIEWLENLEDIKIAKEAFAELEAVGGDRSRVGWLKWDDVEGELE